MDTLRFLEAILSNEIWWVEFKNIFTMNYVKSVERQYFSKYL